MNIELFLREATPDSGEFSAFFLSFGRQLTPRPRSSQSCFYDREARQIREYWYSWDLCLVEIRIEDEGVPYLRTIPPEEFIYGPVPFVVSLRCESWRESGPRRFYRSGTRVSYESLRPRVTREAYNPRTPEGHWIIEGFRPLRGAPWVSKNRNGKWNGEWIS